MAHTGICSICGKEELPGHKRNFHTPSITLKAPSRNDYITLKRGDDQCFKCPVCTFVNDNYQSMYNHWNRMTPSHLSLVDSYIKSHSNLEPEVNNGEVPPSSAALDVQDADVEMTASASDSQTSPAGPTSEIQSVRYVFYSLFILSSFHPFSPDLQDIQVTDSDMAAFNAMSPYVPSPIQSPDPFSGSGELDMLVNPVSHSPATPPRFTAQEKGKGRLQPTGDIPPLRLTMHDDGPASTREDHAPILPIPYGSPDIITSPYLNRINCIVYVPLRILICVICHIAVQPKSLLPHRKSAHSDSTSLLPMQIQALISEYNLLPGDIIVNLPNPFLAIPGIPYSTGLRCTFPNCSHGRRGGRKKMGEHITLSHQSSIREWNPVESLVQVIFHSNTTNYPVTLPEVPVSSVEPPDMGQVLFSEYLRLTSRIEAQPVPRDSAHLTPFLATYNWDTVIQGLLPSQISAWISLPAAPEAEFSGLVKAVQKQYFAIAADISHPGDAWTTVLRYINTSTSKE
jgi:Orsellinic acid/F9775 biosynthesis cluster protein D